MLSHPAPLPFGSGWSFELKWDGFRAIVSTEDGLEVRSRRGWNMTPVLPELRALPAGLVLDGELVAWKESELYFPLVCRRVLNRHMSVPLTFVRADGKGLTTTPSDVQSSRVSRAAARLRARGSGAHGRRPGRPRVRGRSIGRRKRTEKVYPMRVAGHECNDPELPSRENLPSPSFWAAHLTTDGARAS